MEQADIRPNIARERETFLARKHRLMGTLGIRLPKAPPEKLKQWFGAPPTPLESTKWRPSDFRF